LPDKVVTARTTKEATHFNSQASASLFSPQ
jgi:hypothetical protein